jgi:biopolymer transport protein ExbB
MIFSRLSIFILATLLSSTSMATQNELSTLFDMVKESRQSQQQLNKTREQQFLSEQALQQNRVDALKAELNTQQQAHKRQQQKVIENSNEITQLQAQLDNRTHSLKDLFSAWKQTTQETLENQQNSLLSAQFKDQIIQLNTMLNKQALPDSNDLTSLKKILQQDIANTGQVTEYAGMVTQLSGENTVKTIQRTGPFTATANQQFLVYDSREQSLKIATKQPDQTYLDIIESNTSSAVIDPSRGIVLQRLALKPTLSGRIQQGGIIGYVIISLGIIGLLLATYRWLAISLIRLKIKQQLKTPDTPDPKNPLGRILAVYHDNPKDHIDSLEVKLQEAVLQEVPKLDQGLGAIKLLAAVAPLLGLLGTVVGMINTFQTITLVGSTDPKLMAGGISQALVTTVLGLVMTVPLLFSHSFVSSRVRMLVVLLSQQSLGIIAQAMEGQPENKKENAIDSASEKNHV